MKRARVLAAAAVALLAVGVAAFAVGTSAEIATVAPRRALLQGNSGGGSVAGQVLSGVEKAVGGGNSGNTAADKSSSSPSSPPSPSPPAPQSKDSKPADNQSNNNQQSKDAKPADQNNQNKANDNKGNQQDKSNQGNNNNNNAEKSKEASAPAPAAKDDKKAPAPAAAAPAPAAATKDDKKAPAPAPAAPAPAAPAPSPAKSPAPAPSPAKSPAPAPSPAESKDASKDTKEKTPDGKPVPVAPPGKPAGLPTKDVPAGPSGIQPDNGSKDSVVPSDNDAKSNTRDAKVAPVDKVFPGVEIKNDVKEKQEDPSGKGLIVGTPINPESAIKASRSSGGQGVDVKQGPSQDFARLFNEAPESSGNVKPELRGVPQWGGGGGGGGGGSWTGNNYYPINWLNANVYAIPRYTPAGILGFFTGIGSTQSVIVVLDNWAAKVVGWGPTPVYRAPAVGFTFSWGYYEYLWYGNTWGSWGWKTPPLSLLMYDNFGNRLQVEVFVTLNLKTWEIWSVKVTNIQFLGGGGWGGK